MSRTIEVDFLPQALDEAKEKPRILIIDNSRDFTLLCQTRAGEDRALLRLGRERTSQGSPNSATR